MTLSDRLKRLVEYDKNRSHNKFERIAGTRPIDGEPKVLYHHKQYRFINGQRLENARLIPLIHQLIQCVELADICTDKIASYGIPIKLWSEVCQPFEVALAALEDEVKKMEESK